MENKDEEEDEEERLGESVTDLYIQRMKQVTSKVEAQTVLAELKMKANNTPTMTQKEFEWLVNESEDKPMIHELMRRFLAGEDTSELTGEGDDGGEESEGEGLDVIREDPSSDESESEHSEEEDFSDLIAQD